MRFIIVIIVLSRRKIGGIKAAHWKNGMIRLGMTRNVETNVGNIFNGALSTLFYGRLKIEREL